MALALTALAAFAIELFPALTTVSFHEWLGIACIALLMAHCLISVREGIPLTNLALDAALIIATAATAATGMLISGSVLVAFGMYVPNGYFMWKPLHALAAKVLLALLAVHMASHLHMLERLLRRNRGKGTLDE